MESYSLRILVVDDDPIERELLGRLVEGTGDELIEAADGQEGLAKVREQRPDIVITNGLMPLMDGIDLVRAIRADPKGDRIYILLITTLEDEANLLEAFDAGVDDFMGKPLRDKIISARLRAGQRIVRLQRENERHMEDLRRYSNELKRSNRRLRNLALTDDLTGLPNRRYAMDRIQKEWKNSDFQQAPLSCMIIDLDGFKQVNDAWGHQTGDEVLKLVASVIRKGVRSEDIVCRIGGDEFLVICPNGPLDAVVKCGERLVNMVRALGLHAEGHPSGISIGAAQRHPDIDTLSDLISAADREMYRAKQLGKNCVSWHH